MSKVRVYEVAKQLNLDPKAVVGLFQSIGIADVRNHMSSVDPDQVERVKRHLEKQRTHDVVEERIRPTVLKRRAVAKPAGVDSSPNSVAPAAASRPSVSDVSDVASRRDVSQLAMEAMPPQTDVLADRESARMLAFREIPEERAERRSSSDVAKVPPAAPSDRPSTRAARTSDVREVAPDST